MIIGGGLIVSLHLLHAQTAVVGTLNNDLAAVQAVAPDSIIQITAESQGLALMDPTDLPRTGTFWVIVPGYGGNVTALPYPCMPGASAGLPVYDIMGNIFLVDDTGGQVLASGRPFGAQASSTMIFSTLELQANTVVNLIDMVQGTQLQSLSGGMMMNGSSSDNGGFYSDSFNYTPPTNFLWLEITGQTNAISSLVIHVPWNVTDTNLMFDVFVTTNLSPTGPGLNWTNWLYVTRCAPGQTNLFVSPLPGLPVCFFRLGTMQDSDGDGLPDAFEMLVSHTDPNVWDSNGNGVGDGDEISPSGLPWRLELARRSAAVVYANAPMTTQGGACGQYTVYLPSPAPAGGAVVQYYLSGTAALNSDYTLSPAASQLTIPAGYSSGSITLCAVGGGSYSDMDLYTDIILTNATSCPVDGTPARVGIVNTNAPGVRVYALPSWTRRPCPTYGTNTAGFYFIRDGDSTNALTVKFSLAGGTAVANADFAALPAFVSFPVNVRTNWLPISIIPNSSDPTNKTLLLTITNAPGYQVDATNGAATLTIGATAAPALPVVQITNSIPFATTAAAGQFTITRSFATANPLRVYFHAWNANNTVISSFNGQDTTTYNALPDYVDIPANATTVNLSLTATVQLAVPQLVPVTLAAGDYTIGANNTATVIVDAAGSAGVSVAVTRTGVHNGTSGGCIRPAELTFTRTGSVTNSLSIAWFMPTLNSGGFVVTSARMAGYSVSPGAGQGQIVWPVGQSVIKTNLYYTFTWQGGFENDDYSVYQNIYFSNALYNAGMTVYLVPAWELVQLNSILSPATTVVNGTSSPRAFYISRPYTHIGTGPNHSLQVTVSATGSAVSGTDYTMGTVVNIAADQITAYVPVQALNATNQGWRTLVARLDPAVNNSYCAPDAVADTAFARLENPNNLVDDTDMDGDGIPDGFELSNLANGLDPITPNNPYADADRDGLGLMEELSLGLNPNVADAPPAYPSIEDSDYVPLTMRVGSIGKMLTEPASDCAVCHAVTMRAGKFITSTSKTDWTHNPQLADYVARFVRGTNYEVQVTCNPFASSLLGSNAAAATTSPKYTAAYVAQFLANSNAVYPFIVDTNNLLGTNLPMVKEVLPKRATLYVPDLVIATDNDRDSIVDWTSRADRTTATNPFVFWINDDCDTGSDDTASDLDPTNNPINSANSTIDGLRDLEDFARMQMNIVGLPGQFLTNGGYQVTMYLTNLTGSPSLRLFPAVDGGLGYLTNTTTATAQMSKTMLGVLSSGTSLTIAGTNWQTAGANNYFLPMIFEGITTGSCIITFGFSSNNAAPVALSRPFYLNLQEVTSLYEHWTVGDDTTTEWNSLLSKAAVRTSDSAVFNGPATANEDYIVFVHGWRMQPWERRAFASTAYKRLYWQNYKGKFGLFSWPTEWMNLGSSHLGDLSFWTTTIPNGFVNLENFDVSERRAWCSGKALLRLLDGLNKYEPPYHVRLTAHSMGNVVAGEALRLATDNNLKPVLAYVALQGALASHCYDSNAPVRQLDVIAGVQTDSGTFNLFRSFWEVPTLPVDYNAWNPYLYDVNAASVLVNYCNPQDAALFGWRYNQDFKPDWNWSYYPPPTLFSQPGFVRLFTFKHLDYYVDRYEIFSRAAEARCYAMGAQTNLAGPFHGNQVNLQSALGFTDADSDHSGEFNSTNQRRAAFWDQVLTSMQIPH